MEQQDASPVKKPRLHSGIDAEQEVAAHEWTSNPAVISNVVSAWSSSRFAYQELHAP
jgi:hypothetical protein